MIFYHFAICALPKNNAFRSAYFKLRFSHCTKIVSNQKFWNIEPNSNDNKRVFLHKEATFSKIINRSCASNATKKEDISWSDGICDKLVRSSGPLQPFLRLIRLDKPTGKSVILILSTVNMKSFN